MIEFVLCLANEMFSRESFLAYRPNYMEKFTILGILFVCINGKDGKLKPGEPVIAEIASFATIKTDKATLMNNSFRELSKQEVKEINLHFLTEIKEVSEKVLEPA